MQPRPFNNLSALGRSRRLLLSAGFPLLLLLAFIVKQFCGFDSIGWHTGFSHPLIGWDHSITMLAVGIWAAQLRGHAIWMLPLAFVGVMSLGGFAGALGFSLPSVEGLVLLSCAVFSVLITRNIRFSSKVNVMIVAFFGFFHGYAHGQEISTSASLISYTLGFMLATLLLHGAGILVAKLVVLAATCLLAMLFSQAALAKQAELFIGNHGAVALLDTMPTPSSGYPSHLWYGQGADFQSACDALGFRPPNALDCGAGSSHMTLNGAKGALDASVVAPRPPAGRGSEATFAEADSLGQIAIEPAPSVSQVFRHHFPDINHTPGQSLLCNGVGLTSPPAAHYLVLSPLVSLSFNRSPIDRIEAFRLRAILADTRSGNIHPDFYRDLSPEPIHFKPISAATTARPSGVIENLALIHVLVRNDKRLASVASNRRSGSMSAETSNIGAGLNRLNKPSTF